jgi:hypothetical protein
MTEWIRTIRCYVSLAGRNKISDWYFDLSKQEQSDADEFIKNARKLKKWEMPIYRQLGGGIGELRWKSENKQQRLIGYFKGETWYAVIGCTHKQRIYTPSDALNTAAIRKNQIEQGVVSTVNYDN